MPLHLHRIGRHRATDDSSTVAGRRLIPEPYRVPDDWSPLAPARALPAGPNDRTGLLPAIPTDTRCPR